MSLSEFAVLACPTRRRSDDVCAWANPALDWDGNSVGFRLGCRRWWRRLKDPHHGHWRVLPAQQRLQGRIPIHVPRIIGFRRRIRQDDHAMQSNAPLWEDPLMVLPLPFDLLHVGFSSADLQHDSKPPVRAEHSMGSRVADCCVEEWSSVYPTPTGSLPSTSRMPCRPGSVPARTPH